jgi:hypothetical protein
MAWSFAVGLIMVGLGLTAWVFASSGHLPDEMRLVVRGASMVVSLAAFVGAFRLVLLATATLRVILAQNLADLIVTELNGLRQAAQKQAAARAGEASGETAGAPAAPWPPTDALPIPRIFGEREEVRRRLGPATEQTLEPLLVSLESYNRTIAEAKRRQADGSAHLLWQEISVVQERLKLAARALTTSRFAS